MFRSERKIMKILAIESSCDETAAAVVEDGRNIISSVVASQVEEHKLYGGVVPEIASRRNLCLKYNLTQCVNEDGEQEQAEFLLQVKVLLQNSLPQATLR